MNNLDSLPFNYLDNPEVIYPRLIEKIPFLTQPELVLYDAPITLAIARVGEWCLKNDDYSNALLEALTKKIISTPVCCLHTALLRELLRRNDVSRGQLVLQWTTILESLPADTLLNFCRFGAYISLKTRDYQRAREWYLSAISIPNVSVSDEYKECLASFILLQVALSGHPFKFEAVACNLTSSLKKHLMPYTQFVEAFSKGAEHLKKVCTQFWRQFEMDEMIPFILFALEQYPRHLVRSLKKMYKSISLLKVADKLALPPLLALRVLQQGNDDIEFQRDENNGQSFIVFRDAARKDCSLERATLEQQIQEMSHYLSQTESLNKVPRHDVPMQRANSEEVA
ncbi:COP9/signalosome complex subunit Csn3 [Schizosaccharomyces japonicus yFS275]|uniref:COP9/signalosome complex subunit Csn3 n=1 Tax=Schizosaccharomyces japonicus (strain yFS275 / FY16936) TaxID=402676 RepID=B6K870_SCHJY|nr:COP9/signalosome complex subunit Csn3 [Schizosaccharomyces japonicus yFS275]EEB09724.1 COP9/signalosome complex subunit Csn3 [Schizosaccharomyces japonicus yFS275]